MIEPFSCIPIDFQTLTLIIALALMLGYVYVRNNVLASMWCRKRDNKVDLATRYVTSYTTYAQITRVIFLMVKINRIDDGIEASTRKSQASFQIIQVSSNALPSMRPEYSENKPEISLSMPRHHHWLFFSHIILSISTACNEVAILSVCPRIQKCNMQNSIIINCLKGNRTFIFVYLIIHLGK